MAKRGSPAQASGFLAEHGEELARLFLLVLPDRLDAEDLFHALIIRLHARGGGAPPLPTALRSALSLLKRHVRRERRSRLRPVDLQGEGAPGGRGNARAMEAWARVPLAERAAVALLLGFGARGVDVAAAAGRGGAGGLAADAERGLLLLARGLGGRSRLPSLPRESAPGEALAALLAGRGGAEAGGARARVEAELDSGLRAVRLLRRDALGSADWRRMRKRAEREMPVSGGDVLFDRFETAFGWFGVASQGGVVVATAFGLPSEETWLRAASAGTASRPRLDPRALRGPRTEIEEYFAGRRKRFTFAYRLVGASSFRASVLDTCGKIPYGAVRSYKQVAEAVGRPGSMRAVGGALARNPLPVVIPCHRVIPESGYLGGFSAGPAMKERLLSLEGIGDLFVPEV